jgi:hypothetical protein
MKIGLMWFKSKITHMQKKFLYKIQIFNIYFFSSLRVFSKYESSHIIFSKVSVAGRRVKRLSGVECKNFKYLFFFLFYAYFLNIRISYESSHIIFSKVSVAGRRVKRFRRVECKNF